jgi:transcriptional regulator with XRE-family HTH domain
MPRKKFSELEAQMGPARIAASNARVKQMIEEMPLHRVREARNLTQKHLADILQKDQSAISQIERRTDMYVRTLAAFIEAMGGELEIRANFPDGTVRITGIVDRAKIKTPVRPAESEIQRRADEPDKLKTKLREP